MLECESQTFSVVGMLWIYTMCNIFGTTSSVYIGRK